MSYRRVFASELIGTLALLAVVVGSGIMGERLANGSAALALLANAAATAGGLYVLIIVFAPISGAHFNPAVTLALRVGGHRLAAPLSIYLTAQFAGAALGVWLAHAMFELPLWQPGTQVRNGLAQGLSETVATFGLLLTIVMGTRHRAQAVPALVASYIFAAYWFTASTSFANPAVTLARSLTQTFAGIRLMDVPLFVAAQLTGAMLAIALARWLLQSAASAAEDTTQSSIGLRKSTPPM